MNKYLLIIGLMIIHANTWAQIDSVDVWISKINNNQLRGTCHYAWVIELDPAAKDAFKLIHYGKNATGKLIQQLSSSNKGIISHFILSSIWGPLVIGTLEMDEYRIKYRVSGLEFFEVSGYLLTSDENLAKIKAYWNDRSRSEN